MKFNCFPCILPLLVFVFSQCSSDNNVSYTKVASITEKISIDYTEIHDEWINYSLLKNATRLNSKVNIYRLRQRGEFIVDGQKAMDFPVCTGKRNHETPIGKFRITQKNKHHISNIYGTSMPYFMRLTNTGIGIHVGPVFCTPQSHGCIRTTRSACKALFHSVDVGTSVLIFP